MHKLFLAGKFYLPLVKARIAFFIASLVMALAVLPSPLAALPCVDSYIADTSGEYVYYKDNTFRRKSYVGFLYYDDSAFAARYYAPADEQQKLPPKDVSILVSVNPDSNHLEITGEKIVTSITPEDTDIVNYLHDLMYDFTERRQKVWEVSPETVTEAASFCDRGIKIEDDYPQFGGKVSIFYDYFVPIFNVRKIVSSDGAVMFEAVTAGQLVSSGDKSFTDFKGFPDNLFSAKSAAREIKPSNENQSFVIRSANGSNQKIELDSQWQQNMDNVWFLGDSAMLSVNVVPLAETKAEKEKYLNMLKRRMLLGTTSSYIVWQNLELTASDEKIRLSTYYYQNNSDGAGGSVNSEKSGKDEKLSLTKDTKILTKMNESEYGFFSFTVFDAEYRKNHAYFDSVLNSYKIER